MNDHATVFVVDDDEEARQSVCFLVKSLEVRCEAYASAEQFLDAYHPDRRGCLVTDLRMKGMSGLDLQREIARRKWTLPVILISAFIGVRHTVDAMKRGATDVLEKPYSDQDLWDSIQAAIRRDAELRSERAFLEELKTKLHSLTPGEQQVLGLVAAGLPNKSVAARLGASVRTVEDRRRRVMKKFGVDSFAALIELYAEMKELGIDPK